VKNDGKEVKGYREKPAETASQPLQRHQIMAMMVNAAERPCKAKQSH